MFEPVWNANYVDHVQITMAEDIGIGGRAGYYDGIGAARDVIQNHLLQLLALTAMEEPVSFDAESLRPRRRRSSAVCDCPSLAGPATARGQYADGWQGGERSSGYLEEEGISPARRPRRTPRSNASTSTPGAGPGCRSTCAPASGWAPGDRDRGGLQEGAAPAVQRHRHRGTRQNALVIRVQPDEGVTVRFGSKVPGTRWRSAT
jgi:glucose-6-phosphate 1-dehydrogenase